MPRASIDIGSNSLVFLVLDDDEKPIHDESRVVSLGAGLAQLGVFQQDRMDAAMDGFRDFSATANSLGVAAGDIQAVATSASRRATNADAFFAAVLLECGIAVRTISGLEEAQLTWRGATFDLDVPEARFAVVDLGGGSTEVVIGHAAAKEASERHSLPLGTVRLNERFFDPQPAPYRPPQFRAMQQHIETTLSAVEWHQPVDTIIAVAGTATTLAAMELGLQVWDSSRIHGTGLSHGALDQWIERLLHATPPTRRQWARVSPERADNLLAGAAVLNAICKASGQEQLTISNGGIRHGVLLT